MRYVLIPGRVTSTTDGDSHYVSARALAGLYGVPFSECVPLITNRDKDHYFLYGQRPGDVLLRPRRDGVYRRPDGKEGE